MERIPKAPVGSVESSEKPFSGLDRLTELHNLEADLEQCAQVRKTPGLAEKLLKTGRITLSALIFGGGISFAKEVHIDQSETPLLSSEYEVQKKELRAELLKATGIDLLPIAEAAGFTVEYSVRAEKGSKVILHIGQTHLIQDQEADTRAEDEITKVQKSITTLLNGIHATNPSTMQIFSEGLWKNNMPKLEKIRALIAEIQPQLHAPINENSMETLQKLYEEKVEPLNSNNQLHDGGLYAINHLFHEREKKINTFLTSKKIPAQKLYVYGDDLVVNERDTVETQRVFLKGAAYVCFAKQNCTLEPLGNDDYDEEISKLQKETTQILKVLEDTYNRFIKTEKPKLTFDQLHELDGLLTTDYAQFLEKTQGIFSPTAYEVLKSIMGRITALQIQAAEYVFIKRERFAVEQIDVLATKIPTTRFFPMIYGSAHNFSQAVTEFNKNTGAIKYGLVTMKYRDENIIDLRHRKK